MKKYVIRILFLFVLIIVVCIGTAFYRQPGYLLSWFDRGNVSGKSIEDMFASALIDVSTPERADAIGKEDHGGVKALTPGTEAQERQEEHPQRASGNRKTAADRYPRLATVMADFEALPTGKELEAWRNNDVHQGWMLDVEDKIGETLGNEEMDRIARQHIQTLYVHNRLVEKYASEEVSWRDWIAACAELTQWSDEVCRRELTDGEYEKLWGYGKSDPVARENIEALWTPPDSAEVFVLFPEIKGNDPTILTEEDLYRKVPREKAEQAVSLFKKKMYEQHMQRKANRMGKIDDDEMCRLGEESEKAFEAKMKELLSADEYRYFLWECEGCGIE